MQVALAVAVGACGVAALGPLRAHWAEPSRLKVVALSLVAWPILTGVPAFVVTLLVGFIVDRMVTQARRPLFRDGTVSNTAASPVLAFGWANEVRELLRASAKR